MESLEGKASWDRQELMVSQEDQVHQVCLESWGHQERKENRVDRERKGQLVKVETMEKMGQQVPWVEWVGLEEMEKRVVKVLPVYRAQLEGVE